MTSRDGAWLALVLLTVLIALGAGCLDGQSAEGTPTPDDYTLEGQITDPRTGDGIPDVTISVDGKTTETDSEGEFAVDDLQEGKYTVVAEKAEYLSNEITIRLTSDRRVAFNLLEERFYNPEQSALSNTHWENDVTCETCHDSPRDEIQAPPPDGTCTDCHSMETIRNQTAEFTPNPHDDPHGRAQDCSSCHRVHEPSVNGCSGCHSEGIIPDPP